MPYYLDPYCRGLVRGWKADDGSGEIICEEGHLIYDDSPKNRKRFGMVFRGLEFQGWEP